MENCISNSMNELENVVINAQNALENVEIMEDEPTCLVFDLEYSVKWIKEEAILDYFEDCLWKDIDQVEKENGVTGKMTIENSSFVITFESNITYYTI